MISLLNFDFTVDNSVFSTLPPVKPVLDPFPGDKAAGTWHNTHPIQRRGEESVELQI